MLMKIVFCLRLTFCVSDLDSRDEPGASFARIWLVDSVNYDRCSETDSGRGKNFSYSSSHLLDKQWHAKPYFCLENVTAKWLHWSVPRFLRCLPAYPSFLPGPYYVHNLARVDGGARAYGAPWERNYATGNPPKSAFSPTPRKGRETLWRMSP